MKITEESVEGEAPGAGSYRFDRIVSNGTYPGTVAKGEDHQKDGREMMHFVLHFDTPQGGVAAHKYVVPGGALRQWLEAMSPGADIRAKIAKAGGEVDIDPAGFVGRRLRAELYFESGGGTYADKMAVGTVFPPAADAPKAAPKQVAPSEVTPGRKFGGGAPKAQATPVGDINEGDIPF